MSPEEKPVGSPWGGAVGSKLRGSRLKAGLKSGITSNISKDLEAIRAAADAVEQGNEATAKVREALDKFKVAGSAAQFKESIIPGSPGAQRTPPPGTAQQPPQSKTSSAPPQGQARQVFGQQPAPQKFGQQRLSGPTQQANGQSQPQTQQGQPQKGQPQQGRPQQGQPGPPQSQQANPRGMAQQASTPQPQAKPQQPGPAQAKPGGAPASQAKSTNAPAAQTPPQKSASIFDQLSWGDEDEEDEPVPQAVLQTPSPAQQKPLAQKTQQEPAVQEQQPAQSKLQETGRFQSQPVQQQSVQHKPAQQHAAAQTQKTSEPAAFQPAPILHAPTPEEKEPVQQKGGSIFDQLSWGDDDDELAAAPLQSISQIINASQEAAKHGGSIFDQLNWSDGTDEEGESEEEPEEEQSQTAPVKETSFQAPTPTPLPKDNPISTAKEKPGAGGVRRESPLAEEARAEAAERNLRIQQREAAAKLNAPEKPIAGTGPKPDLRGPAAPKRTGDRKKTGIINKLSMEVRKPSEVIAKPKLEKPAPKGQEYFIHKIPGSEFYCRSQADGFITDFWLPDSGARQPNHYKWTGTGYRRFFDETNNYDSHSPAVLYPQASMDDTGLAAQVTFGSGISFLFHFDGRFEERDLQDRPLAERDTTGQQRIYHYKGEIATGVSIKFADEPVCATFSLQEGSLQPGTFSGYEYTDPKTGHQEVLKLDENYWTLKIGDRNYWFPKECMVKVDRYGTRRLATETVVFFEGTPEGYSIIRNAAGHVVEVTTPDGVLNLFSRRTNGVVEQVIVINGQGQVVEHSTRTGERWDAAEVANITVDDTTGVCSVFFAEGQEVRRNPDGTQELVGASGDYCLDADRIAAYVPLANEEKRQMLADLACISRIPFESQSWVYNAIWELASATDTSTQLTEEQRCLLVLSLAHQIAHPEDIRQGYKDTAVAAVAEKALAMLRPDLYSDMLSKLASTGEYRTGNGVYLTVQRRKDGKLADYSDSSGARSLASEILQTTFMRRVMPKGQEYRSYPAGHEPVPYGVERSTDAGERIIIEGKESRFTGPPKDALLSMLTMLTPEANWVSVPILSPADLDNAWRSSGFTPPMPVSVRIDIPDPTLGSVPFTHSVIITNIEYDAGGVPQKVYFENTSDGEDHSYPGGTGVPIKDFVRSMQVRNANVLAGTETVIPAVALVRTSHQ